MKHEKILRNYATGEINRDILHAKARNKPIQCSQSLCFGSSMSMYNFTKKAEYQGENNKVLMKQKAAEFITEYYEQKVKDISAASKRMEVVCKEISSTGSYTLTKEELQFGATMAWRNAPRCPGRIQWRNLMLFDRRDIRTTSEAFEALLEHIKLSTNEGKIKPAISVFAPRRAGRKDIIRVWNKQLIAYAGYQMEDGTIRGDNGNLVFTQFCERLGWKSPRTNWDVLPLIISDESGEPQFFDIPEEYVLRVKIRHPSISAITDMNLEWNALPAVSSMCFEIGGLQFPGAPFSGWYSLPEIATRDLLDQQRYNLGMKIAKAMDLDTESPMTLWLDKVNTELNKAVMSSFGQDGVSIVDHHTQAEQFMDHFREEHKTRGGCPADWVWIVPPEAGSLTPVFHQEMLNYQLSPSYDYQQELHLKYLEKQRNEDRIKISLKSLGLAALFARSLYGKMLAKRRKMQIFYATETGNSKRNAMYIFDKLKQLYNVSVDCISTCSIELMSKAAKDNSLIVFVTSTFGNGDPPVSGRELAQAVKASLKTGKSPLEGLKFAVLALGSSSYQKFCAFGKFLDASLTDLGGQQICPVGTCDEMKHALTSLRKWTASLMTALGHEQEEGNDLQQEPSVQVRDPKVVYNGQDVHKAKLVYKSSLTKGKRLFMTQFETKEMDLKPGDHVAVYPRNGKEAVRSLMTKLGLRKTENGKDDLTFELLTQVYDISSPPSQEGLSQLLPHVKDNEEKDTLESLLNKESAYEDWRAKYSGGTLELWNYFPSLKLDAKALCASLDFIRPRWYSVANNPHASDGTTTFDIVWTLATFSTPNGEERRGLCTNYFMQLQLGSYITFVPKRTNAFQHILSDISRPKVLIAVGSGIGPVRGLWLTMLEENKRPTKDRDILVYGCRNMGDDVFFFESAKVVKRYTALSREEGISKTYVQDLITEHSKEIASVLFRAGGSVVVSGPVSMAEPVRLALESALMRTYQLSDQQAEGFVEKLKMEGRFVEEIFGGSK